MPSNELILVFIPLVVLLVGLSVFEMKTTIIPDVVIFPATLYFLAVRIIIGPNPWWHYPVALLGLLLFFILCAALPEMLGGKEWLGGGAIKMTACVGLAFGMVQAVHVGLIFLALLLLCMVLLRLTRISTLPTSPIMLATVVGLLLNMNGFIPNLPV